MHRPEDLLDSVENDAIARLFARVICGKTAVIARMPILRRDDEIEAPLQFICNRNDLIAMRYRQGAARHKIVLKIDEDQRVHDAAILSRLSLGKGEGRVRVRIFSPLYWKTPHLPPSQRYGAAGNPLPFSEGARRMSARVVSLRSFLGASNQF
jgi:hypothetical protein